MIKGMPTCLRAKFAQLSLTDSKKSIITLANFFLFDLFHSN